MIQVQTCDGLSYLNFEEGSSWETDDSWLHIYSEEKRLASFRSNEVIFIREKQD